MRHPLIKLLVALLSFSSASAWPESPPLPDSKIVQRADLIVVAHVKSGSLNMNLLGGSYESRAILEITEVIKGKPVESKVSIFINYGLLAVPKQYENTFNAPEKYWPYTYTFTEPISLFEDNPDGGDTKIVDDIRQDQVWLLHKGGTANRSVGTGNLVGIWDHQDVQPLSKEIALRKLLK
jgi:hypothetical protein